MEEKEALTRLLETEHKVLNSLKDFEHLKRVIIDILNPDEEKYSYSYHPMAPILMDIANSPNKCGPILMKAGIKGHFPEHRNVYARESLLVSYGLRKNQSSSIWNDKRLFSGVIDVLFTERGVEIPNAYRKVVNDEFSRRFVRDTLLQHGSTIDPEADKMVAELLSYYFPRCLGDGDKMLGEHVRTALIWERSGEYIATCFTKNGGMASFRIPSGEVSNNMSIVSLCDEQISDSYTGKPMVHALHGWEDDELNPLSFMGKGNWILRYLDEVEERVRSLLSKHKKDKVLMNDGIFPDVYKKMLKSLSGKISEMSALITASLDPEVSKIMNSVNIHDVISIAWMSGSHQGVPFSEEVRIRMDAEDAYVVTGPFFALAQHKLFREAVTNRVPVVPVIRELAGVTKAQYKVYSEKRATEALMNHINELPPMDPAVIREMSEGDISRAASIFQILKNSRPGDNPETLAALISKEWKQSRLSAHGCSDMIKEVDKKLIIPMSNLIHGREDDDTIRYLRERLYPDNVKKLFRATEIYHEQELWRDDGYQKTSYITSWSPLTTQASSGHLTVSELSSTGDIHEQGIRQNHCVGSYAENVLDGNIMIVNVHDESGPVSTAEIVIGRGGREISLRSVQHKARFNAAPDEESIFALSHFLKTNMKTLTKEDLDAYQDGLRQARMRARRFGFGSPEHAFMTLADILPPDVVRGGYLALETEAVNNYETNRTTLAPELALETVCVEEYDAEPAPW